MGFFDKLIKAVGFEGEDTEEIVEEQIIEKKKKEIPVNAKFELNKKKPRNNEKNIEVVKENKEVLVFAPKKQEEVEEMIEYVSQEQNAIINFSNFSENDKVHALDFVSGAVFVLKGKIQKIEKNIYLIDIRK